MNKKNILNKNKKKIKNHGNKIRSTIFGFFLLLFSIFFFLSFFSFIFHWENDQSQIEDFFNNNIIAENMLGKIGALISHFFIYCSIGISAFFIPILLFITGLQFLFDKKKILNNLYKSLIYQFIFFSTWIPITSHIFFSNKKIISNSIVGFELGNLLTNLFGRTGTYIIISISGLFDMMVIVHLITCQIQKKMKNYENIIKNHFTFPSYSSYTKKKIEYKKNINMLHSILNNNKNASIDIQKVDLESNKKKIYQILNFYHIKIFHIKVVVGPNVILYEIVPHMGIRISKIKNLENELALNLSASSVRIIAPIPGKNSIGIEIPNNQRYKVYMKEILFSKESKEKSKNMELPISLGKTIFNEIFIIDLVNMPHILIAGSTGQGKSVGLNAIIVFLLYKKNPKDLKFILIDPKKVELSIYEKISKSFFAKIPHSKNSIITDLKEVEKTLNALCKEMDKRFSILKKGKVRNIQEYHIKYNSKKNVHLPYIVLIIDEFADLSMFFKTTKIEIYITRLAQLSRAVGIHMIIATQRPSVNVITGLIKSNFTARISFKVSSKIDSRTILDCSGAEKLIGRGDLLFSSNKNELIRLQSPFMDLEEIQKIVNFYEDINQQKKEYFLPEPDKWIKS
ncbi:DNA translocase FtsK 4TM domain-containing protein [Blattabacterium cuenoti]|uniref:DNA translocase FtsK 4TM domain-containing protein n=1 Tax=Blattabacterium cuenoti TaxID=1653831 RepID=UPI00163BE82D|nr:DNA translocase FtsK 4TM domain-containing protein [Blattabacterium cuenoti]